MILCMENLVYLHCLLVDIFRIIKYWFKINEFKDHKYVNIVYRMLRNDIEVFPNNQQIGKGYYVTCYHL